MNAPLAQLDRAEVFYISGRAFESPHGAPNAAWHCNFFVLCRYRRFLSFDKETNMQILQLDIQGYPQDWISPQQAASYYATDSVAWTVGEVCLTLRGGVNARSGECDHQI